MRPANSDGYQGQPGDEWIAIIGFGALAVMIWLTCLFGPVFG